MKIKINGKEYNIKYGYKPTLKERVISKVVRHQNIAGENGEVDFEKIEDLLIYLPELLLVGLQVHHKDFRYNYDTGEGKEEQLEKAFNLVEEYCNQEDADIMDLFNKLNEALEEDSFLSSLMQKEQKAIEAEESMTKENNEK